MGQRTYDTSASGPQDGLWPHDPDDDAIAEDSASTWEDEMATAVQGTVGTKPDDPRRPAGRAVRLPDAWAAGPKRRGLRLRRAKGGFATTQMPAPAPDDFEVPVTSDPLIELAPLPSGQAGPPPSPVGDIHDTASGEIVWAERDHEAPAGRWHDEVAEPTHEEWMDGGYGLVTPDLYGASPQAESPEGEPKEAAVDPEPEASSRSMTAAFDRMISSTWGVRGGESESTDPSSDGVEPSGDRDDRPAADTPAPAADVTTPPTVSASNESESTPPDRAYEELWGTPSGDEPLWQDGEDETPVFADDDFSRGLRGLWGRRRKRTRRLTDSMAEARATLGSRYLFAAGRSWSIV